MPPRSGEGSLQSRVPLQFARGDGFVNSRQVLIHDSPGSEIEMAHFRVAHLTIAQTHIGAAGAQFPTRIVAIELVVKRRMCEKRGIAVFVAFLRSFRINSPTIADDEHHWTCHSAHCRDYCKDRRAVSRARKI